MWPLAAVARVLLGFSRLEAARVPAVFSGMGCAVARLWCGRDVMALSVSLDLADGDVCIAHAVHMSIDDAAYRVVHEYGAPALAARLGMSVQVLRNKANPQLATHVFRPQELEDIQLLSGKPYVLHSMAHALGYVCQRAMPGQAQGDVMLAQTRAVDALAELLCAYGDGVRLGDGAATLNAVRRAEHCAQLAIEAINDLTATLRGRMRPAPGGLD